MKAELQQIEEDFAEARACYERLCITAEYEVTQEAARHVLHYASILTRIARGKPYDWRSAELSMFEWQQKFYIEIRRELHLRRPSAVFRDPVGGMPPGVPSDTATPV